MVNRFQDSAVRLDKTLYLKMHVMAISEKRSHEFEREQGGTWRGQGRKGRRKCCNDIIILLLVFSFW